MIFFLCRLVYKMYQIILGRQNSMIFLYANVCIGEITTWSDGSKKHFYTMNSTVGFSFSTSIEPVRLLVILLVLTATVEGLSMNAVNNNNNSPNKNNNSNTNRRTVLHKIAVATAGALTGSTSLSRRTHADVIDAVASPPSPSEELIELYFGCGCFWHVQHEFVAAEQKILHRADTAITARTGYAGGKASDASPDHKVCYHNALSVGDYGKQGHGEVVAVTIPAKNFDDFVVEYFNLFDAKGDRPDQFGDVGLEYRNLIGLPGGAKGPYAAQLIALSQAHGDKLDFANGKGSDKDARAVAYVMDTAKYPFYVAEQYHQFHDGFNFNENYPKSYNALATTLEQTNHLEKSLCTYKFVVI